MAQDKYANVERLEGMYEAFNQGDIEPVLAGMDDEIEWHEAEGDPYGGMYHGLEAVVENIFMPIEEDWETFEVTPERFITEGNTVVVRVTYSGTASATGKSFEAPGVHIWDFEDRKVTRMDQHADTLLFREPLEE